MCDTAGFDCSSPQNHEVYVAGSDDGASWGLLPNLGPLAGSVPDIIVRDEILYIYSAESGGMVTRYDLMSNRVLSQSKVGVENVVGFVDPAPILDEDGNIVLFFLRCRENGKSVHCFGPDPSATTSEPTQ